MNRHAKAPVKQLNKGPQDVPVLQFFSTLHLIDVHADRVLDVRRGLAGAEAEVFKDDSGPVCLVPQELQRFADQPVFCGDPHELIQVQTLRKRVEMRCPSVKSPQVSPDQAHIITLPTRRKTKGCINSEHNQRSRGRLVSLLKR